MANPVSNWINMFLGKPRDSATVQPKTGSDSAVVQEKTKTLAKNGLPYEEDSITSDINNFKKFSKNIFGKASTFAKPYAEKGSEMSASAATKVGSVVDKNFLRKVVRVFLILFFLIILVFVGTRLFKIVSENGDGNSIFGFPSPTPAAYDPYKPSIYSDDPEINTLEQDITVLESEISGTNIRESNLNPPALDFNISF